MADKPEYRSVLGFVQFPPNEREYDGKPLQDALIQHVGDQKNYRVTIWPEQEVTVAEGDLIVANGKYTTREKDGLTYYNISATRLKVFPGNTPASQAEVVNALEEGAEPDPF